MTIARTVKDVTATDSPTVTYPADTYPAETDSATNLIYAGPGAAELIAAELEVICPGRLDYQLAWDLQRRIHAERVAGQRADTVILLEHPPVYTAGRRTEPHERPFDGTAVIDVDRGGKITWHGPGQLVGYPILALPDPIDVVSYVRRIEQMLITVCAGFGVSAVQVPGRSGVWVDEDRLGPQRKIGAIGIRVASGVSMHGFALNCDPDLSAFGQIVPCGISDASVTSLSAEQGRDVSVADVLPVVQAHLHRLVSV